MKEKKIKKNKKDPLSFLSTILDKFIINYKINFRTEEKMNYLTNNMLRNPSHKQLEQPSPSLRNCIYLY